MADYNTSTNGSTAARQQSEKEAALAYHAQGRPGKLKITATKPMDTQRDLSLAYSPGVAHPVLEIGENPELAYEYTAKGNLVAVISDGSAIPRPGQPRRPGLQAGDGGQGRALQALCRHRRL